MDMARDTITGTLPGGYTDEMGTLHRHVVVAPLTGRDEELLFGSVVRNGPPLVTALLARCARFTGGLGPVTEEVARKLLVADRQYLLTKLREAALGQRVRASVTCPAPECLAKIDIDFAIGDIPVVESEDKGPTYTMELSREASFETEGRTIVFRLPNGEDQEIVAALLAQSELDAAETLLARCILSIGSDENPGVEGVRRLSGEARAEVEARMEATAPSVALAMDGECPECGNEFDIPFDIQDFLLRELRWNWGFVYREVHYLAYHYHWSEREIMEMPREKRRRYIEVLSEEIGRLNDAVLR